MRRTALGGLTLAACLAVGARGREVLSLPLALDPQDPRLVREIERRLGIE